MAFLMKLNTNDALIITIYKIQDIRIMAAGTFIH
jgi:hypothetical protein